MTVVQMPSTFFFKERTNQNTKPVSLENVTVIHVPTYRRRNTVDPVPDAQKIAIVMMICSARALLVMLLM